MSGRLVGEVLRDRLEELPQRRRRSARAVLVALAEDARDGRIAWPSVARIAERSLLSERQVVRVLNELEQLQRIAPEGRAGGRTKTTRWRLLEASERTGKGDMTAPFDGSERVTSGGEKGDIAVSPEPYEPSSPLPPIAEITPQRAAAPPPPASAPTLPGLGRGEDGVAALGRSSRAAGRERRDRRAAAEERRHRRDVAQAMAERAALVDAEWAAASSPEAIAARDAVRARMVGGGRGP